MKRARSPDTSPPAGDADSAAHQPKISRKIRACQACQHRKVKCDLENGQERCSRCTRLDIKCVVNKSLQTLLDGENEWKSKMEAKVEALQTALADVQRLLNVPNGNTANVTAGTAGSRHTSVSQAHPPPQPQPMHGPSPVVSHGAHSSLSPSLQRTATAMTRENSTEPEAPDSDHQAIVNAPMASLFEATKLRNIRSDPWAHHSQHPPLKSAESDFIAQGRVSLRDAEYLFDTFRSTLNAYLWGGIALVHETLDAARASSSILTSAILAVTSLHTQDEGRAFDICYPVFLELVSQAVFDRYHTLDDVRGLCIGAFWLSDLSWKLSGLAVRIATELNLHQFCAKSLRDGSRYGDEARLWYFLYVCDHHFSIAYGRPPVIAENPTITCHEHFLQRPDATQADFRLHSQVGIFIILSRVFHAFGPDRSRMIGNDEFEALRRFDADMGFWRDRWKDKLQPNKYVSQYPAKGVFLHYHFARLLLFSICLRGLRPSGVYAMSPERRQFVNKAIASATAALDLTLNDPDMRASIIGVPLYLLTTMAYACLFLMKCQAQWKSANLNISYEEVVPLIEGAIAVLNATRPCVRHVAHYLGSGLNSMLEKFKEHHNLDRPNAEDRDHSASAQQVWSQGEMWPDWNVWMFGNGDLSQQTLNQDNYGLNFLDALNSQMPG
ncbi:Zn(2)-C6 fungal-type DNA-binding domain protein [Akanthomyces lecanii RCEF 1005]|uniref:Zn(2)-C6 fungal-type DNA-binding domain protein n=1 Tax=Akanthomyces lecanii RCEF 1005 TaxID=1081108 RepID=A0A168HUE3_CORDF|nr:Zn(2)-C6 fungal-type DNA-binding domain protein [Akanthomyces lecanii RCEF 1005]